MSTCEKHDKANGSWRANSPLWPYIEKPMCYLRPDIREQSNLPAIQWNACKPRRSPYTDIRAGDRVQEVLAEPFPGTVAQGVSLPKV